MEPEAIWEKMMETFSTELNQELSPEGLAKLKKAFVSVVKETMKTSGASKLGTESCNEAP